MAVDVLLKPDLRRRLRRLGKADLVVGIPSCNNVRTIGHVVRAVQMGLAKYFPAAKAVLVDADGGSTDDTIRTVEETGPGGYDLLFAAQPVHPLQCIATPYHGVPGKGNALRTVFRVAVELEATACAVVDADLRSIEPAWMDLLLSPVMGGYDLVAPLYHRHKFDGTLTTGIVYPLTRALYGLRIRQPTGGDFGFSAALARHFLEQSVWEADVAGSGIDTWMTTVAATGGFRICEAFLGARIRDAGEPGLDLAQMLRQVVGAVFDLMESREAFWKEVRGSRPVPLFGLEHEVGREPVPVDPDRMVRGFRIGRAELGELWSRALRPETARQLGSLETGDPARFRLPAELWVRIVHDFAVAHHRRVLDRSHLLRSFAPLFQGRVASYVREAWDASAAQVEVMQEQICLSFEELKGELLDLWEGSGRSS